MIENAYKTFIGKQWIKIFYHNIESGYFNTNFSKFLHSEEENQFSIFDQVTDILRINGMFEFMLDYGSNGFIVWRQNTNPVKTYKKENNYSSIGLRIIYNRYNYISFNGLMLSNNSGSFLDAYRSSIDGYWYSIGTKYFDNTTIPGHIYTNPGSTNEAGNRVNEVTLWLRMPSRICTKFSQKYFHINNLFISFLLSFHN